MTKYKWWLVLAVIYAAFLGVTALQFSVDSAAASEGQFVYGKDRSSNPIELTVAALDGQTTWNKLTSRIDAEESSKVLPAGPLEFWPWFSGFTSIYGLGYLPFTFALISTWIAVVVTAVRVHARFCQTKVE